MIPVKQTKLHNPPDQNGNCFAAVISSITGIPIEEMYAIEDSYSDPCWSERLTNWLLERGWLWRSAKDFEYRYGLGKMPVGFSENDFKDQPYLVIGRTKSFNGEVAHICIYMNGDLVHDPHPDNTGLTTMEHFEVIQKVCKNSEPTYTLSEVLAALPDEASKEGIAQILRLNKQPKQ